ncbi:MAG: hypothetical protein WA672_01610 [Candidatus Angelobacter sp.]
MEATKPITDVTAPDATTKNGRGGRGRRWEMSPADVRYFLPKTGTSSDRPELGREMTSEGEALVEAFRTGQIMFTVVAWKAVPDLEGDAPKIVKQAMKRS